MSLIGELSPARTLEEAKYFARHSKSGYISERAAVEWWEKTGKTAYQEKTGREKQAKREEGGIAALQKSIALFDKNFGKGMEARARAAASSQAVLSGLGGTTRPGAVSAGLTAEFEDMRRGRMATAQSNLASFLGSYRDPYAVTPQVNLARTGQQNQFALGQQQLQQSALGQQQQYQLGLGQLELGQAQLQANITQTNRGGGGGGGVSDSIWNNPTLGNSGSGTGGRPITQYTDPDEELYQGGWTG